MREGARILRTTHSQVPMPLILSVGLFESDQYFEAGHTHGAAHDPTHGRGHSHDHSDCDHDHGQCVHDPDHTHQHYHSDHLANDGFVSLSFQSDHPFSVRKFQQFLDNDLPLNVFRAKGILWFDESPKRHVFHLSGKRFSLEDEEWKGNPKNQLVLIGQGLDLQQLRSQLEQCLTTS